MSLADKVCVQKINDKDRKVIEQEDFENLTSYVTESIKSECYYQFNLEPIIFNPQPDCPAGVFRRGPRISKAEANLRMIELDLDEAAFELDNNYINFNIDSDDGNHSEGDHIKNL